MTSTPNRITTMHRIESARPMHVDARPVVAALVPGDAPEPELGDGPQVQLWPHVHGTDAMHLSLLRRDPAGS